MDICYRPAREPACRAGTIKAEVDQPGYAYIEYGSAPGSDSKTRFETTRRHDTTGADDTYHLPSECPFGHDAAVCPYPGVARTPAARSPEPPRPPDSPKLPDHGSQVGRSEPPKGPESPKLPDHGSQVGRSEPPKRPDHQAGG